MKTQEVRKDRCFKCSGKGFRQFISFGNFGRPVGKKKICKHCNGTGYLLVGICNECNRKGWWLLMQDGCVYCGVRNNVKLIAPTS